ncbi:MAG: hypothetical protein AAGB12_15540 [Pseudomonadota bacterium]
MTTSLDWYALCAVILFYKMFLTSLYQAYFRFKYMRFKNTEDAHLLGKLAYQDEHPQVQRAAQVWHNDWV